MQIVDLDRVSAQRPGEDGWGQRDRLFNDERRRERDIEDRLEHRGHGGGGGSAGPITLDPVVVHAPQPPPPQPQPAPPPPIVDLPPVTALPPDGPLPSYGDLLAERREQRRYATDEEYRQFWRGEQQRILQFGLGPVMDAIDMVRAPFEGRWRDTLLNVLSLFGGKWLSIGLPLWRRAVPGIITTTPVGKGLGFPTPEDFKAHFKTFGPDWHWHHIVEQNPVNKSQFDPTWLHNEVNMVLIHKDIHSMITNRYSRRFLEDGSWMRYRDHVNKMPFEEQHRIGVERLKEAQEAVKHGHDQIL